MEIDSEQVLEIMRHDQKRGLLPSQPGTIDLVLLEDLGQPHRTEGMALTQVAEREMRDALQRCRAV